MREESKGFRTRLSAPEFLSVLEDSGVIPVLQARQLQDRQGTGVEQIDATSLARQLVKEGTLTPFQARRLLKGKRGLVFGRYVLLDHIGQGARGRVFKARHSLMDRVVALKVVLPDASLSRRSVSRFFREMKIVGRLDHPNVVRALDADVHEGCPYIVMEYLEGEDLEQIYARSGPLPPREVVGHMAQAARGLAHAHEKGVLHRDIKPTNLFLVNTGAVKVLDLGLGDLVGPAEQGGDGFDTDEGVVVGTTDFMSPELVQCQPFDARTDLFSLGCTMYRLLAGDYAFPGLTREDRLIRRIQERPVPITDLRPDLDPELVEIVDRLLAIRPEDRFGSATELADALEALDGPGASLDHRASRAPSKAPGGDRKTPAHAEPDAPPDWSRIESALRPGERPSRGGSRLVERDESRAPTTRSLSSHRKSLEEEGVESGREAHEKYRNELIQMNRVMAELRSMEPDDQSPDSSESWYERLGERIGDHLAEPSSGLIAVVIVAVLLILGLALAYAVG